MRAVLWAIENGVTNSSRSPLHDSDPRVGRDLLVERIWLIYFLIGATAFRDLEVTINMS